MFIQKLKETGLFIENEYFFKYVDLILSNLTTPKQRCKTQRHHIIPAVAFDLCSLTGKNESWNFVNLLYKDHILAHYYLALCSKGSDFSYKMVSAINFIIGRAKQDFLNLEELKNFTLNLDRYQELYEKSREIFGARKRGTTHSTSEETKSKIGVANKGRIVITKDGKVKSIHPEDLNLFLQAGWVRGNPNSQKRDTGKGRKIIHKDSVEKYCRPEELDFYLANGWEVGRSTEHKLATKNGTKKYYSTLSAEERHKKCCTRLGAHFTVSEETKRKISASNKGKHLTAEQRIKAGLANKGRIHITNGIEDKMIYPEEEAAYIEKGFYRGRSKNRKDYKNSQKEVMTY